MNAPVLHPQIRHVADTNAKVTRDSTTRAVTSRDEAYVKMCVDYVMRCQEPDGVTPTEAGPSPINRKLLAAS